jgi:hypothetical protein
MPQLCLQRLIEASDPEMAILLRKEDGEPDMDIRQLDTDYLRDMGLLRLVYPGTNLSASYQTKAQKTRAQSRRKPERKPITEKDALKELGFDTGDSSPF